MGAVARFCKKYWITAALIVGICALYYVATHLGWLDAVLFPTPEKMWAAFMKNIDAMPLNFASSMGLLIPSLALGTVIALAVGILMGMHKRLRESIYPIIYAISVIPAILPFHLQHSQNKTSRFDKLELQVLHIVGQAPAHNAQHES